jgi:hypothetical protein
MDYSKATTHEDVLFIKRLEATRSLEETVKILLQVWEEKDPGLGNSWDDCAGDISPCIERLEEIMAGSK